MPATTVSAGRAAARPAGRAAGRKNPLRVVTELQPLIIDEPLDPFVRVAPLKGARGSPEGRIVPLSPATARSLVAYPRVRRGHRLAACPVLWLGTRNRGRSPGPGCTGCSSGGANHAQTPVAGPPEPIRPDMTDR